MLARDRGWVHNHLEARGHDIHLPVVSSSNTARFIGSAARPQHTAEEHFTKPTCHSLPAATAACASETKVQYRQKVLHKLSNANKYLGGNGTAMCSVDVVLQRLHPPTRAMEHSAHVMQM